jgi:DNA-binding response OmpR family regulator
MEGDRDRILQAGIDGYLSKPLNKSDLHAAIRAHAPARLAGLGGVRAASA